MDASGSQWHSDGDLIYRTDELGVRIGVLPATCRLGAHSLAQVGYRAHNTQEGTLTVRCNACRDTSWRLRLTGEPPARAELDDLPYRARMASSTRR
jgi:hypothetical protein